MPHFHGFAVACRIVIAVSAGLTLAACQGSLPPPLSATEMPSPQLYKLSSGDKLRITVYNEPNLSNEFSVSSSGDISFPLVGSVMASGLTAQELSETVEKALVAGGYQDNPKVSVEVLKYRPYYILGEVNRPGQYEYASGLTFEQAIAAAGGFTYRASTKRIIVRRGSQAPERSIDLVADQPVAVMPGDTIRVLERRF